MRALGALKRAYGAVTTSLRRHSPAGRDLARRRAAVEVELDAFARRRTEGSAAAPAAYRTVLVDGTFDNPNYWFRFSMLRRALGLASAREIGLVGPWRRNEVRGTFARLKIAEVLDFAARPAAAAGLARQAQALVDATRTASDILEWKLPGGVHPSIVYDGILKRQRLATIDLRHPDLVEHTRLALEAIERAREILDESRPDLVVVSHPFNFGCGSLAWLALSRGIPVVLPFGLFGVLRFTRFTQPADLFRFYDRPTRAEIDGLEPVKAEALAEIGRAYLERRFGGKADDLASVFAFQRNNESVDRASLCVRHGWDPAKPIVAFYASNWFDWPHQLGMDQFRDFLDWTDASFEAAKANDRVNWLFKPHPAEDWFGGVSLSQILAEKGGPGHVALAEKGWNNTAVMNAVDVLVTYHGTAGVEFASLGKPVLVPDRGKYEDCGFVRVAQSRQDYLDLLGREWWLTWDTADARRRAEVFAGWWFCAPQWQGRFVLGDDARQDVLYDAMPGLLDGNSATIEHEIGTLVRWWKSGHAYYHTSKMAWADAYMLSNV